jgi:hypothetical protein
MFLRVKFGENSPIIEALNYGVLNLEKRQYFITMVLEEKQGYPKSKKMFTRKSP